MKKLLFLFAYSLPVYCLAQEKKSAAIYFDSDLYTLSTTAINTLDSLVKLGLQSVSLSGHCDITASHSYNDALSHKRVQATRQQLLAMGIGEHIILAEHAFGKRQLINANRTDAEKALNRRVMISYLTMPPTVAQETTSAVNLQNKTLQQQIEDSSTQTGDNIVLQNLNFYGGTHTILPSSLHVLIALLETMKKNPNLEIAVEGHICCTPGTEDGFDIGTQTKNLSENRAREVCLYLAKNGIAQHRLHYKGFGHSQPLTPYPEQNEQERINNRRVEIKILKK